MPEERTTEEEPPHVAFVRRAVSVDSLPLTSGDLVLDARITADVLLYRLDKRGAYGEQRGWNMSRVVAGIFCDVPDSVLMDAIRILEDAGCARTHGRWRQGFTLLFLEPSAKDRIRGRLRKKFPRG